MAVITSKGQITIPKKVRARFGLHPGTEVEFEVVEGKIVLVKRPRERSLDRWVGRLEVSEGVDAFVDDMRGEP